jgi:ABC-type transport system involved in multi-copper enzyme maturation permease subunit
MLLTDLSDAEIVLGKLAARLVPVLTLIACTLPVMELLTLIGGLEPVAVLGTFVVTVGVAVLGCSLAMVFSLWLGKTHVALLATYGVCCLWLVVAPIADLLGPSPSPLRKTNPFYLALAPYLWSDSARWTDYLWFLGTTCSISALLIALAVLQLRPVCTRERGKRQTSAKAAPTGIYGRVLARSLPWLTPSLDRNPVLWHEWHRGRLSRIGLVVTVLCVTLASLSSVLAILSDSKVAAAVASGLLVAICLLYLSVTSATSLAEERARGSLDILLTTPLSARQIVLGKWLGTFRIVPLLAILPWLVIAVISYIHDERSWWMHLLIIGYMLSSGAAITGLGVATSTWFSRPGRAIAMTVAVFVAVTVGSISTMLMKFGRRGEGLAMASPFYWAYSMTLAALESEFRWFPFADWAYLWIGVSACAGVGFLLWMMAGFDTHLGRMEDRFTRIHCPSRRVRDATTIYFGVAAVFFVTSIFAETRWELVLSFTGVYLTLGKLLISLRAARPLVGGLSEEVRNAPPAPQVPAFKIVMARWLGSYRIVVPMVFLPALFVLLRRGPNFIFQPQLAVIVAFMLLQNAAVVSLGVALSAWFKRRGQALVLTLLACAVIELVGLAAADRLDRDPKSPGFFMSSLRVGDKMSFEITLASVTSDEDLMYSVSRWSVSYGVVAGALLILAIALAARSNRATVRERLPGS